MHGNSTRCRAPSAGCGCARRRLPPAGAGRTSCRSASSRMVNEVSDEVVGFGPIEFLLKDPEVTEVMVNGPDDVYVERRGARSRGWRTAIRGGGGRRAPDRTHRGTLGSPGRRIVALGGRATSGRLAGPRDRAAPLAPRSRAHDPQVLARAHRGRATWSTRQRSARACSSSWRRACAGARTSSCRGGAGSRQDDAARRPLGFIPDDERLITIEDAAELRLAQAARGLRSRPGRRTSRGAARSRSATWCATRSGCGPTASSSARSAAARRSTCSRR